MRWRARLILVVALVALAAVTITALLSVPVTSQRVQRFLDQSSDLERPGVGPRAGAGAAAGDGSAGMGMGMAFGGERHAALQRDLWRATLQAAAIALLVAAAAGVLLADRLVRPLRALTRATMRYAAGDRGARAPDSGGDEVAEVAGAFNRLADRLQGEEEQQRRLLADVAHELRTPLTVLKGELEALEDGLLPADGTTFRRLAEELRLLERLVQDLRLLTQADSGALTLERGTVALDTLVAEVVEGFEAQVVRRGLHLLSQLEPVRVSGDALRLRQVVGNLLDNGARHSPPGGSLEVSLRAAGAWAELTVRDHGPGIPAEERERVFQRLYRIDRARSRASGGSGLGLAIVRSLVDLHGGEVRADEHPEGGALLRVRLPLAETGAPAAEPPA